MKHIFQLLSHSNIIGRHPPSHPSSFLSIRSRCSRRGKGKAHTCQLLTFRALPHRIPHRYSLCSTPASTQHRRYRYEPSRCFINQSIHHSYALCNSNASQNANAHNATLLCQLRGYTSMLLLWHHDSSTVLTKVANTVRHTDLGYNI